jgi:nitroreductase
MTTTDATMNVMDAIAKRRSVRSYTSDRLDRDTVSTLLAAAIRAPTAIHEEQWAFVVVQGKPLLKHLSEAARMHFIAEQEHTPERQHSPAFQKFNDPDFNIFYDADTLIVICAKSTGPFVAADCWLAAENLMLAACAKGLGTCVIGSAVSGLNTPKIKAELGIPEDIQIVAPIIVGVPNGETPITERMEPRIISWKGNAQ